MPYPILILPLAAGLFAQSIKFLIRSNGQKFQLKNLTAYSGMPSGHSAIVVALATIIGLEEGFQSSMFALSVVFATVVIRDALGIRQYLGQHGQILNILVKDLQEDKMLDEAYPKLLEKIGHTPAQVLAGSLLGFVISFVGYFLS
jgi:acid phosphatase family membrane protein YuiD